jgi:ankyrin repeat protein
MQFEKTALLIAAEKGDAATAQVLLQAGANKEARELVSTYTIIKYCVDPHLISHLCTIIYKE